jgi:transcription elongation factor Elf1
MAEPGPVSAGTYKCPVCGHRDAVDLEAGSETVIIVCSYCETPLEVSAKGPDSVRLSVQVARGEGRQ